MSKGSTDYVVGGLLAFGMANAFISIIDTLVSFDLILSSYALRIFEGLIVYIVTSMISGYIIANRTQTDKVQESLKAGWFAFLLNTVLMAYYRTFYGLTWILVGYSIGGAGGGFLSQLLDKRMSQ